MSIDSVEPLEGSGQNGVPLAVAPWEKPEAVIWHAPAAEPLELPAAPLPRRWSLPRLRRPRVASESGGHPRLVRLARLGAGFVGFAVAFFVGVVAALLLVTGVALGVAGSYSGRVLPGVHAGPVDLAGLSRDQVIARLQSEYAYLGQGEVTITTPAGAVTITYQQAGRGPDVEVMADAAMAVGHTGYPLADAASLAHDAAYGQDIAVVVRVDPNAVAQRIHELVATSSVAPLDASVSGITGRFSVTPSAPGRGIDEASLGSAVISQLTRADAPADVQAGGTFGYLSPRVTDQDAQAAIDRAAKMDVDVHLTWSSKPEAAPATWTPQNWTISASQLSGWITFGLKADGTYKPTIDAGQLEAYLSRLTANDSIPPTEPTVVWDAKGTPVSLEKGLDGSRVGLTETAVAISAYLDKLATDGMVGPSVEVVTTPIPPQIETVDNVASMVDVGQWTTTFYPDISNGFGKNIRQPAANLNGKVIAPGARFSFLDAMGPIDADHGFTMGGVIVGGKSDHTGAMGGGICSASTTMFNAAANAGLQIDERHPHFYYIYRYPVGRDATVYSNGATTWDLQWTNDTPYPIVIRSWATYGSTSTITIQLWTWTLNRTVTWTGGGKGNIVVAGENPPEYVTTLAPGETNRTEYATNGFSTSVERVVTDSTGKVLHDDVWGSSYTAVNGQLQIGGSPPAPTPAPTPTPAPAPTPAPSP
jgi:vancomycin resistance protein YoaR